MWSSLSNSFVQKDRASSSSSSRGQAATSSPYLSLILAADFTAGMRRWDQPLSVLNEHGVVTALKTTQPRNRGLGCTSRYHEASTKTALLAAYLTVKHTWQPVCHETRKLFGCRMFAAAFRCPLSLLSQNTWIPPVERCLHPVVWTCSCQFKPLYHLLLMKGKQKSWTCFPDISWTFWIHRILCFCQAQKSFQRLFQVILEGRNPILHTVNVFI